MLSIMGQHKFYAALSNFLGIIGYWTGDFRASAVVNQQTDHLRVSSGVGVCDLC
jgi:hypothetical protein